MNILFQKTHQRGFGTYPLTGETLHAAVAAAAEAGYRAFDTAQMYGNEADTGAALAVTGLPRDALCVTTKVHPDNYTDTAFLPSVEASLRALRLAEVDVLLLHWPPVGGDIAPPLRLLEGARARGLARNIGLSNFTVRMMREAAAIAEAPLVTNQVEFHPLLNQDRLLAVAAETGIPLSAYSPIARGRIFDQPLLAEIGAGYGKSAAQVALRWVLQKGVSFNAMSKRPENIRANFEVMDFTLSSVDMARIERLTATGLRIVAAGRTKWTPEWD